MPNTLAPHPFAALFPELPPEELRHLARDIKERGQLEPIILYRGLILDGRNRYRACQMAGVKPRTEEFNPKVAKRSPEEFVVSRNLRRRHLSVGQKAAIALDWSEQIDLEPRSVKAKERGRPKGPVSEAAKHIGVNEQRVFEVRQIRDANLSLYQEVRAGKRSLNGALAEISPSRASQLPENGSGKPKTSVPEVTSGAPATRSKEAAEISKLPPSPVQIQKALNRIKAILGNWFHAEAKALNLVQNQKEIIQLARLTDAQMLEVGPLLKRGWTFVAARREIVEQLTPDDEIRALHTRAVENGQNWCTLSVGKFWHVVVWGAEKDKTLAKVKDTLAKTVTSQRS
jgi:hypothetical protein